MSNSLYVQMAARSMRRSDPVALIIPISLQAEDVLALPQNRRYLCNSANLSRLVVEQPKGSKRRFAYIAKLTFATFALRSCVCIGASRAAEIKLPAANDISDFHLSIHFDMVTGALMITDTSTTGTWIGQTRIENGDSFERLHRSTMALSQDTSIYFGLDRRYHFRVDISRYTQDALGFGELFKQYVQSAPWSYSTLTEKPASWRLERKNSADNQSERQAS
ncbi:hypothetical protein KCU93_g359, partial [Aureobasidium melanogenum]